MRYLVVALMVLSSGVFASEKVPFNGSDFSGIYRCNGQDDHEGPYTSTVKLSLVKEQSTGKFASYSFNMDVPDYGTYPGYVAANGREASIHFALTDPSKKDFGTGIAHFSKAKNGKWRFSKFYYEPEFKGGNYGMESCVQQ
jgi:hypothetical protein